MNRAAGSSPRLLAVAYGGGHIAMVLPVLAALRRRVPGLRVDLLALTTARRPALEAGESPLGYADLLQLLTPAEQARALELGEALRDGPGHPDVPAEETLAYLGINALDLEQRLGVDAAAALLAARSRQAFHPSGFMRRVVEALAPDLVLATNSPRSEEAVVEAAREAGVPSLALLDLFALPGDRFAARTTHPDRVCVLAPAVADNLVAAGWPADIVRVTGNPAFDRLHTPEARAAAAALRRDLGWDGAATAAPRPDAPSAAATARPRVVLLATQPEPLAHPDSPWPAGDALAAALDAALRAWVAERPGHALIVRHHPSNWHLLPRPADSARVHFSVPGDEAIETVILAADAVVVQASTVGLQAAAAAVPVLSMRCSPAAHRGFDYAALGVARGVDSVEDLPAALDAVLAAPPGPTPWAAPGSAADGVAEVALELLDAARANVKEPTP